MLSIIMETNERFKVRILDGGEWHEMTPDAEDLTQKLITQTRTNIYKHARQIAESHDRPGYTTEDIQEAYTQIVRD